MAEVAALAWRQHKSVTASRRCGVPGMMPSAFCAFFAAAAVPVVATAASAAAAVVFICRARRQCTTQEEPQYPGEPSSPAAAGQAKYNAEEA